MVAIVDCARKPFPIKEHYRSAIPFQSPTARVDRGRIDAENLNGFWFCIRRDKLDEHNPLPTTMISLQNRLTGLAAHTDILGRWAVAGVEVPNVFAIPGEGKRRCIRYSPIDALRHSGEMRPIPTTNCDMFCLVRNIILNLGPAVSPARSLRYYLLTPVGRRTLGLGSCIDH